MIRPDIRGRDSIICYLDIRFVVEFDFFISAFPGAKPLSERDEGLLNHWRRRALTIRDHPSYTAPSQGNHSRDNQPSEQEQTHEETYADWPQIRSSAVFRPR